MTDGARSRTERPTKGATLVMDRCVGRFGRIKRATGTDDPEIFRRINDALTTLQRTGKEHILQALVDRRIHPLDLLNLKFAWRTRPVSRHAPPCWLYVMRSKASGYLKIGVAQNVHGRLTSMRSHTWDEIELLGCIPGTRTEERGAHRLLRDERVRGEWFRPGPKTQAWLGPFLKQSAKYAGGHPERSET